MSENIQDKNMLEARAYIRRSEVQTAFQRRDQLVLDIIPHISKYLINRESSDDFKNEIIDETINSANKVILALYNIDLEKETNQ